MPLAYILILVLNKRKGFYFVPLFLHAVKKKETEDWIFNNTMRQFTNYTFFTCVVSEREERNIFTEHD